MEVLTFEFLPFPLKISLMKRWKKNVQENKSVRENLFFVVFFIDNESLPLTLKVVIFSFILIYGLLCNKQNCKATSLEGKSWDSKHIFLQDVKIWGWNLFCLPKCLAMKL